MKMRILIVDDEFIVRKGMKKIIEEEDSQWSVIGEVANGVGALEFMKREVPDIVITDIRMASMDGIRLSWVIKEKWPDILIIVVSGYSEFQYAREAVKFGAIDYLLKPTAPSELIRSLKNAENILRQRHHLEIESLIHTERKENSEKKVDDVAANNRLINDAITYMQHRYSQELSSRGMAEILNLNPNYFCDLFKKETGFTFLEYLTKIRISAARQIFERKINVQTSEVAEMVGYHDSRYFSRIFKNATGMTPSEYKNNCIRQEEPRNE